MLAATYSLLLVSCDSPFAPDDVAVARIETTPLTATISVGETRAVTVRVLDAGGATLTNRPLFWSSQNPAIASVSQDGIVSGIAAGGTQIAVSVGGKSAIVPVTVNARPVSLVRVTPSTVSIIAGATTQLAAQALDAGSEVVEGRPVIWATGNAAIATVTSTGLVTGVATGTTNITATIDGVVGSSVLTVQPVPVESVTLTPSSDELIVGQQLPLTATARDATGLALAGRAIAWSSNAPATASVSSTGVVTALSQGTATITATSEGKSATSNIIVSLVPIDTISVTPRTATVAAGQTLQLVARLTDADGTNLTGRLVTWDTDQPTIATVSTTGVVSAISAGRATITVSAEGKTGVSTVTVTPVPVASVSIQPNGATILIGKTQQFSATARDASNTILPGRSITWISGAPSVATVTQAGLVTAVGAGSALIFAASEGISTSVTVTVSTVGVAQVRMTPPSGTVQQGKTLQLAGEPVDANGTVITGRAVIWNSSNPSVASVSSTGLVTGIARGTADVTATVDGVIGTSAITVTAIPVATVQIVPASPTLTVGQTLTVQALLFDAGGAPLATTGRTIGWAVSQPAVATVSPSGLVTAISSGTTVLQATVEGAIAQTVVTVTGIPVASVVLAPTTAALNIGQTRAVTATAKDANGNVLTGRPVAWSSSNVAVATVTTTNSTGSNTIVAVGTGTATITAGVGGIFGIATVTVSNVPIATLAVAPPATTLPQGATQQLTVTARDAGGNLLIGRSFTYASSAPAVASVSATGLVTATAPGTANILVTPFGLSTPSAQAAITVTLVPVASLVLNPSTVQSITVGSSQQVFFPSLFDATGNQLSLAGRTITWTSLDVGTATVAATTGVVSGVAANPSPARIVASTPGGSGTVADTAFVTVTTVPVASVTITEGATATVHLGGSYARTLNAVARDAAGNVLARPISWASQTQSVAQADLNLGIVTGVGLGTSPVIASSGGVADTILVTVDLVQIAATSTVTLSPPQADSVVSAVGQSRSYVAVPRDSASNVVSGTALGGRTPTWSVTSGLASLSATGTSATVTPTPGASGTATVSANYTTAAPSATLIVLIPAKTVLLQLSSDSLLVGASVALSATVVDASNAAIPGRVVRVTSNNTAIASVTTATGTPTLSTTVNGVSAPAGRNGFTLVATSPFDSLSASTAFTQTTATATVLAPVTNIVVTTPPGTDSIFVSATVQATATVRDVNGNTLVGRVLAWSTGNGMVATAAQTGLITGVAAGATTIIATEQVSTIGGTKALLVQEPVSSVALVAGDSSIVVGQTQASTVTLLDQHGATLAGRVVTYASSPTGIVSVSASGVITALAAGSTSITATAEGKTSASLPFVVSLVPVASVTVAAPGQPPNVYPSHVFGATVQAFDGPGGTGNSLALAQRSIVW
ncbi:MAG: Ig-like domain-containing protein, partial [Gemmatimonadota bacterium]